MKTEKERYLFLYLNTGGGHLAPAKAVGEAIKEKRDDVEIILEDGLKDSHKIFKHIIEDGYKKSQNSAQIIFEALYFLNKLKPVAVWNLKLVSIITKKYIRRLIVEENPSKIVVFHFFLIKPVIKILKEMKKQIPVVTVVTDPYSAPPIWFLNKKIDYVVFSDRVKNYMMSKRISPDRIKVFPFILNKKFSTAVDTQRLKEVSDSIGVEQGKKTILIMGGGDGMAKGEVIAKKLVETIDDIQVIVVCGKNRELFKKIEQITKTHTNVFALEFVDFVHELISISDIVVTKCGASTFMEILLTGKIPLVNNYIWEQEKGNMEFIRDNNLGIYEKNIDKLVSMAQKILTDSRYYNSFTKNIKNLHLENGTEKVADYILRK